MKDVSVTCTPAKDEFHDDEWKPVSAVPEAKKPDDTNANGSKSQLHLEPTIQRPIDTCGYFVRLDEMAE